MGQAKLIVMNAVLDNLKTALDDLDSAIDQKHRDFSAEPRAEAENHYKLGILTASENLIRRAHAMLEDYEKWNGKVDVEGATAVDTKDKVKKFFKDVSFLKTGAKFTDENYETWELEEVEYTVVTQDKKDDRPAEDLNYLDGNLVCLTAISLQNSDNPRSRLIYSEGADEVSGNALVELMLKDLTLVKENQDAADA